AVAAVIAGASHSAASEGGALRGFPPHLLPAAHAALREAVRSWNPKLTLPNGEEVVVCRAIYEARNAEGLRAKLSACAELVRVAAPRRGGSGRGSRGDRASHGAAQPSHALA